MLQSELEALKNGDKIVYNDSLGFRTCEKGLVLTRDKCWLDDDSSVRFTFTTSNGSDDFHFFCAEELDLIKE